MSAACDSMTDVRKCTSWTRLFSTCKESSCLLSHEDQTDEMVRGSPGVSRRQSHGTPCSTRGPDTLSGVFFSHAQAKQGMLAFVCECAVPDVGVLASEFHNVQLISGQHPAAALHVIGIYSRVVSTLHRASESSYTHRGLCSAHMYQTQM